MDTQCSYNVVVGFQRLELSQPGMDISSLPCPCPLQSVNTPISVVSPSHHIYIVCQSAFQTCTVSRLDLDTAYGHEAASHLAEHHRQELP